MVTGQLRQSLHGVVDATRQLALVKLPQGQIISPRQGNLLAVQELEPQLHLTLLGVLLQDLDLPDLWIFRKRHRISDEEVHFESHVDPILRNIPADRQDWAGWLLGFDWREINLSTLFKRAVLPTD